MALPGVPNGVFTRVAYFPVVQSVYGRVTDAYSSGKEYSRVVNFACSTMESSVQYVASTAQPLAVPIVGKFEGQLAAVDAFACRQLDKLEEKVPIITATPEEMVEESKRYIQEKLTSGAEGLSSSAIGHLVTSRVDHVLSATENVVDYLLPDSTPVGKASKEPVEVPDVGRFERLGVISTKVSTRVRAKAVDHLAVAQKKAELALEKLQTTLELVERAQQQLKEQRIRVVSTVEQQAQRLRSSVAEQSQRLITAVEEGAHSLQSTAENALSTTVHLPGGKSVDLSILLDHSRRLTNTTRTAFITAAAVANHLPSNVQKHTQDALQMARELTQLVHNIALKNEISRSVLDRAGVLINSLHASTVFFADYIRSFVQPANQVVQMNEESPLVKQSVGQSQPVEELSDSDDSVAADHETAM